MVPEGARLGLQGMAAEMLPKTPIAIRNSHLFPRRLTCSLGLETSWKYGAMEFIDQLSPLFLAVTTVGGTDEKGCHESKLRISWEPAS